MFIMITIIFIIIISYDHMIIIMIYILVFYYEILFRFRWILLFVISVHLANKFWFGQWFVQDFVYLFN